MILMIHLRNQMIRLQSYMQFAHRETAVEDLHKKIKKVDDVVNKKLDDILHNLNNIKNQEALSRTEDLSAIKPDLPAQTLEDFGQLNEIWILILILKKLC